MIVVPKSLHELDLPLAVARSRRDRQHAQPLRPVVKPQPAREHAVTRHVLKHIRGPGPGHVHAARDQIRPHRQVMRVVADHGRLPGGPGRRVQPDHVLLADRQKFEGVPFAQMLLGRKRQVAKVFEALDPVGGHPGFQEHALIVGRCRGALERCPQALPLQGAQVSPRHGFKVRFPVHGLGVSLLGSWEASRPNGLQQLRQNGHGVADNPEVGGP